MNDGFSEPEDLDWVTIQMCPAPPGTVIRVRTDGDETLDVPCPMFLLQEARAVITVHADGEGVGARTLEDLEPPYDTRVVPGMLVEYGCNHSEVEAAFAPAVVPRNVS